ncbi:MAG: AAA family ATPase [Planctomycetota bacterium]
MIRRLDLLSFKNFRQATLKLGGFTVLVGTNAAGKSNLRDAFRFIHGMSRGYSLAEIIGEKWVEGGSLQWKGIRGGTKEAAFAGDRLFVVITGFSRLPDEFTHVIRVDVGTQRKIPVVSAESLYSYDRAKLMRYDSHPEVDPVKQNGREFRFIRLPRGGTNRKMGKKLQFSASQPILTQILESSETPVGVRRSAQLVQTALQSMRFLDLAPDAMRLPSLPGQDILGDRGENLSSVLLAICGDKAKKAAVLEWVRQLTPLDVQDLDFVSDQTGRVLVTLVESSGQRTSAYSASDGTLRFLAMIAALFGPKPAKFYFFEEIDNGIHPTRLHLLLQLIEQRVKDAGIQVVATTHSPQLLGFLSKESREFASVVYRLEGEKEGRICRIMDIPEAKKVLETQNLGRLHESGWLENAVAFMETPKEDK